ncbi:D-glycerate dehydrogenase [Histomonas meleagridis]|uniref:D-glycerate dehydrogenase n=1 Tax=Histomonas meleagridis TaxID=135588 RepID=UPI00355A0DB1|nr:D-glycerate dehydrogenase [Histomonas meleagridis]KAH0801799.1 D-glycerate dehydrogenase [Histomonas meleagridis]
MQDDKMKIFVTRMIPMNGIEILKKHYKNVEVWGENRTCPHDLLVQKASECDALLTIGFDTVDEEVINHPNLKVISQVSVGINNIDLESATKHHKPVSYTPYVLSDSCADFAWCLMLAAARQLIPSTRYVSEGKWLHNDPKLFNGFDVFGKTLGIIGAGRIGQCIAKRGSGFSMRILYNGPHRKPELDATGALYCTLDDLLSQSDFVVLACTLNPTTQGLIGAEQLRKMKKTAILVNIARGPCVVTQDLIDALKNGTIAAAALDVTDPEPLPVTSELMKLENCIVSSHIASATIETRQKMSEISANAIVDALNGKKVLYCANPEVYDQ